MQLRAGPKMEDRSVDKSYFHYYSQLYYQQNMLQDNPRTSLYYAAITRNPEDFKEKIVLDIGTGSGILSFFAAQAGAKSVYAIEASSKMASFALRLVQQNHLDHVIKVIPGKIEDLSSTFDFKMEMVDVIISEPMGVLLVHERMLSSYVDAARKWLKPSGKMYPDRGMLYFVPITDCSLYLDCHEKCKFWSKNDFYGVDLSSLKDDSKKQYFSQVFISPIDVKSMMAIPHEYEIDFNRSSSKNLQEFEIALDWIMTVTGIIHGIGGWFDVSFPGTNYPIVLSTSPHDDRTHWHQCKLLLETPLAVNKGDKISGKIKFAIDNERSYDIRVIIKFNDIIIDQVYHLNDQQYWNINNYNCNSKTNEYDKEYYNLY